MVPVKAAKRHGLAKALLNKSCSWEHAESKSTPHAFVVVMDRDYSLSPTETAYGELLHLFDDFLRTGRRKGIPHNGVLVPDRGRYQRALEAWVEVARARRPATAPDREAPTCPRRDAVLCRLQVNAARAARRPVGVCLLPWLHGWRLGVGRDCGSDADSGESGRLVHFTVDRACACPACGRA
jgi:hypothetical protein